MRLPHEDRGIPDAGDLVGLDERRLTKSTDSRRGAETMSILKHLWQKQCFPVTLGHKSCRNTPAETQPMDTEWGGCIHMSSRGNSSKKRKIETYTHKGKKRANNPPVGLVTPDTDKELGKKSKYLYDPHLDPALQWAGKAEHTTFQVPTVSLHVHERIDPRSIIEAVRKKNGTNFVQGSLFTTLEENPRCGKRSNSTNTLTTGQIV